MTAIEGATVRCGTMADGTLRLVIDIEPTHAQDAFRLFGTPGRGVALAALTDGRCALVQPDPPPPPPTPRKTRERTPEQIDAASARWHAKGPLERAAIQLCALEDFQDFIGTSNATEAGKLVKEWCGIESRKVLDTDPEAADAWRRLFAQPFRNFITAREAHTA